MPLFVTRNEDVQNYYLSEAIGQSKLKKLLSGIYNFNKVEDSSAAHFVIGSAVDTILTADEEQFNQDFYVSKVTKLPSEAIIEILALVKDRILEDYNEYIVVTEESQITSFAGFISTLNNWHAYILEATEATGWQPKWGAEAKINNIIKAGEEYFLDLCKSQGKRVLDTTQHELVKSIVKSLKEHSRTAKYFDREIYKTSHNIDIYYQLPIYFKYRGVNCKALLDMLIIVRDPDTNAILNVIPIDLKTMSGNTYDFPASLRTRRYDIQAAWYVKAIESWLNLPEYSPIIENFMFVVESTTMVGKPLVFELDPMTLEIGRSGILEKRIMGYDQLIDMYIYHTEHGFDEERLIKESKGNPLLLSWEGLGIGTSAVVKSPVAW